MKTLQKTDENVAWHDGVATGLRGPVLAGLLVLAGAVGGFAAWAGTAPLSGAVVASARVIVDGSNKIVQHLEGGVVGEVLVRDGDQVEAGQPLILLDGTAVRADAERLAVELRTLEAAEARLLAERDGAASPTFPEHVLVSDDLDTVRLVEDQRAQFDTRMSEHRAALEVFERQIHSLNDQIVGNRVEKREAEAQLGFASEERSSLDALLAKGLARKSQVLALKRAESELKGRIGKIEAAMAGARQSQLELHQRIEQLRSQRLAQVSAQLSDLRLRRADLLERLKTAKDVRQRLTVRAPVSGSIVDLNEQSAGAVIAPGEDLMTIVPAASKLVLEAQIRPSDIDELEVGREASIVFTTFRARQSAPITGRLVHLSADSVEDSRTGQTHYVARLEFAEENGAEHNGMEVGPGHEAEVFIATASRTFLSYLFAPLEKTLMRAFRET